MTQTTPSSTPAHAEMVHIPLDQLLTLAHTVLLRLGLSEAHAGAMARVIVAGQRDACQSHGVYRLTSCAHTVRTGKVDLQALPLLQAGLSPVVRVDARGAFSPLAFEQGLPALVEATQRHGMGALVINRCVHFSALWPEIEAITAHGFAALALTPSHAWVAPEGGHQPVFGTNPIAFGWPRPGRDPFVFDFATTEVARGEIELHRRAGKPVPDSWGYDADGNPTTDAKSVLDGAMRTFGGHKGSALAAMVELLAGPLIGDMTSAESIAADGGRMGSPIGGELIIALDPEGFLGADLDGRFAAAEAMFSAIEAQGARLPSARRYAARAKTLVEGVTIPGQLYADIMAIT